MATDKQKAEILFITKQLNALRLKRNKSRSPKNKAFLQALINTGELDKKKKCKRYGLPYNTTPITR